MGRLASVADDIHCSSKGLRSRKEMFFLLSHGPRNLHLPWEQQSIQSWGASCDLRPSRMRTQLKKEGVTVLCCGRGEFSIKPRGLYRPFCNTESCWMETKRKTKVLPYIDIGNGGNFSTDHFILTSHTRFSCFTSLLLLVIAGDTLKTTCYGQRRWLSIMLCDHIPALGTSKRALMRPLFSHCC